MADFDGGKSIAERCSDVKRSLLHGLEKSKTVESPVEVRKVEDVLDRFKLWTGNLGALHQAHKRMSLESRLADSPEVKDQICEHLDDMQEASDDLLSLLSDSRAELEVNTEPAQDTVITNAPAYDLRLDTPSEYTTAAEEAESILCMISECLKALFRIGILVRRATPRDRFERALQQSEYAFTAQFDINHIEEKYPKLASETSSWLKDRLGNANSKRRQFINYVREHRAKLQVEDSNTVMGAPTVRESSKATTFVTPVNLSTSEFLESSIDDDDDSASLVSASTAFDTETSLRLPSLSDLGPDGEYFECPVCFTLQSFRREKSWKLHAYRDLKAYVCTSGEQDCEHNMFSDRDTWFDHELRHHHSLYVCKLCGVQYKAVEFLEQHFVSEHGPHSDEEIRSIIEHGKLVPSQLKAQDCPFCDDWASILSRRRHQTDGRAPLIIEQGDILVSLTHFKRHVATHQEQLAIFAMPRMVDGDDDRSHGAGDPNSEAFSSKDGSTQDPDEKDLGHILASIDDEFKATVRSMCEELQDSPISAPEVWNTRCENIIETVRKEIKAKGEAYQPNNAPDVSGSGINRMTAARVLLNIYPRFATLMEKNDKSEAHDDTDLGDIHFLGTKGERCKLYKLVNNDWEDRGTGFCKASVKSTETGRKKLLITVKSETEPGPLIMDEALPANFARFEKQQETLIVWTDLITRSDMALSFQHSGGCDAIWEIIDGVQRDVDNEPLTPGAEGVDNKEGREQDAAASLYAAKPTFQASLPPAEDAAAGVEGDKSSIPLVEEEGLEVEEMFEPELERTGKKRVERLQDDSTQRTSELAAEAVRGDLTTNSADAVARDGSLQDMQGYLKSLQAILNALQRVAEANSAEARAFNEAIDVTLSGLIEKRRCIEVNSANTMARHETQALQAMLELFDGLQREVEAARALAGIRAGEGSQVQQQGMRDIHPRLLMGVMVNKLAKGDIIVPPCDRCRRLRVQCVKQLTDCQGCTQKNTNCGWKTLSDDECKIIMQRLSPGPP